MEKIEDLVALALENEKSLPFILWKDKGVITPLIPLLKAVGLADSNTKARTLIEQKGIKLDGRTIEMDDVFVTRNVTVILKSGKRHFRKIILGSFKSEDNGPVV